MLNDSSKSEKLLPLKEPVALDDSHHEKFLPNAVSAEQPKPSPAQSISDIFKSATPLLLAGFIAVIYWLTSSVFIQCKWSVADCRQLTVASAYLDNKNTLYSYPTNKLQPVNEIEERLRSRIQEKAAVDSSLETALWQSEALAKQIAEPGSRTTDQNSALSTQKGNVDNWAATLTQKQTKLVEHIKALGDQLSSINNRQSKIYWSRVTYATFVALFLMVSIACLIIATFVIVRVFSDQTAVSVAAVISALLLSAGAGVWLYQHSAEYFLVINELTSGIKAADAGNIHALTNFLNSFGYTATTALVLAVAALLWFPGRIVNPVPGEFKDNCDCLAERMRYLRLILYVGTAMLLIAIFRMKTGMDWSLATLVQNDVASAETFNKTLITSQGSFFTLLLAAVYIPAAYIILRAADRLKTDDEPKKSETLSSHGLAMTAPSFKEYLPRLSVMLLPFLVGPIADLAKYVFV